MIAETYRTIPKDLAGVSEEEALRRLEGFRGQEGELAEELSRAREVDSLRRVLQDVLGARAKLEALEISIEEAEDRVEALAVIKGILSPNGEARTLVLANDAAKLVKATNHALAELDLDHSLAVDLKLEKGENADPAFELIFEVDGAGGKVLPSRSQVSFIGFAMDQELARLGGRRGFIWMDEPENGLDASNRPKFTAFVSRSAEQAVFITNAAANGFDHIVSTTELRASAPGMTLVDFGVDAKGRPLEGKTIASAVALAKAETQAAFAGESENEEAPAKKKKRSKKNSSDVPAA
jgi:hypothetical protein